MCGRYALTSPAEAVAEALGLEGVEASAFEGGPRYNIAPGQPAAIVRAGEGRYEVARARWGLVPPWSKGPSPSAPMINARAETAAVKPAFRAAFRSRRCLVPADGFYEWQGRRGARRQPYWISLARGGVFAMAGLWAVWRGRESGPLVSFTILTTEANELLRPLHDRMPVILRPDAYRRWLDAEEADPGGVVDLLRPFDAPAMRADPVGTWVNDPRHDGPACLEPPEAMEPRLL